jgi:hypothetical protein
MVTEPGKPPAYLDLRVGEENEWLEVKAIDFDTSALTARLKKPVVRIPNVGWTWCCRSTPTGSSISEPVDIVSPPVLAVMVNNRKKAASSLH